MRKIYLFIDRDGVINKRLVDDYVKRWEEFEFLDGVLETMAFFAKHYARIFIITNQQGVGKGLMTAADLADIHQKMTAEIVKHGGRIDKIYACTDLKTKQPNCRKPNPAMGLQAKKDFSEVDFAQSIIFGDSISDMEFGQQLGMKTVFITTKSEEAAESVSLTVDWRCGSLKEFWEIQQPKNSIAQQL